MSVLLTKICVFDDKEPGNVPGNEISCGTAPILDSEAKLIPDLGISGIRVIIVPELDAGVVNGAKVACEVGA